MAAVQPNCVRMVTARDAEYLAPAAGPGDVDKRATTGRQRAARGDEGIQHSAV